MRHLALFLMCLMLSSLIVATTVHAQETPNMPTLDCSGVTHQDGDADQSSGDADRSLPHHHGGCHGASAFVPTASQNWLFDLESDRLGVIRSAPALPRWVTSPGLRPPIA